MADEIEGVRGAAWHALCAALTGYGYVEPDDLPGLPLADAFVEAFAERGYAVAEVGRLLPPGGEVEWGWRGWSDQDPQRGMPLRDEAAAREVVAAHPGTELVCRQVGPWSPVVSDSSEVPSA